MKSSDINSGAISQEMPQPSITKINLKIIIFIKNVVAVAAYSRLASSQESQWRDQGRFRGDTRSGRGDTTTFQAFQVRGIVQDETDENQSHGIWILSTQVRGFQRLGGGTAQLSRVGPPQV